MDINLYALSCKRRTDLRYLSEIDLSTLSSVYLALTEESPTKLKTLTERREEYINPSIILLLVLSVSGRIIRRTCNTQSLSPIVLVSNFSS